MQTKEFIIISFLMLTGLLVFKFEEKSVKAVELITIDEASFNQNQPKTNYQNYEKRQNSYLDVNKNQIQQSTMNNYNNSNYSYNNEYSAPVERYVYQVQRPEWWEFCPMEYENPKHVKVPITNAQFDNNDWYNLKVAFEKYVSDCDKYVNEQRDRCYQKVRYKMNVRTQNFVSTRDKWQTFWGNYRQIQNEDKIIDAMTKPQQINVNGTFRIKNGF